MKVTHVALRPTDAALAAGSPALTPELLAATGARYSRNNEGLGEILARIDPANLDKSVDAIFRMIDYGHQSIADMVPVALFLDGISQWLAFTVWNLSPYAGGQESSTRYIEMTPAALPDPAALGIADGQQAGWRACMESCFDAYHAALGRWQGIAEREPAVMRIPRELAAAADDKSRKKVARLQRNYAFDRARYYLPLAARTNMMMVMSARAWVQLCQQLCSHPLAEARTLGAVVREQLALSAPRLLKHAVASAATQAGLAAVYAAWRQAAAAGLPPSLRPGAPSTEHPPVAHVEATLPPGTTGAALAEDLRLHDNRYAWLGEGLRRTAVRFAWDAVALAEIRDLNRHRTGTRHCPLRPVGFYSALDEIPAAATPAEAAALRALNAAGAAATVQAHALLAAGDPTFVYWLPMGAQCAFEHLTTADKFIYEAELRTGLGAHYRYARHLHDALAAWYALVPETRGLVLEGSAEPE